MKITYPQKIDLKELVIGVTAPSSGLGTEVFNNRIDLVMDQHRSRGIKIIEGSCLRSQEFNASGSPTTRTNDFHQLYAQEEINLIQPPWGGQRLIEILELVDYEMIKTNPKWIQGYSDISTLLFAITLKTGVATAHGTNFIDSIDGQDELTASSRNYLQVGVGESFSQYQSLLWQQDFTDFADQLDSKYNLTEVTKWQTLREESKLTFRGRMIGGCIDTIRNLIGTPYGNLLGFCKDYAGKDGIILFLENCDLNPMQVLRSLYNMKYANWFDNINGIIFGRSGGPGEEEYIEVLEAFFESYNFPVLYDADIGHKPPQMTLINGSIGEIDFQGGKVILTQSFI